jgi:hypothetical protein
MALTNAQRAELCIEFIHENAPRWLMNPEVLKALGFRRLTITALRGGTRGQADRYGRVWINPVLAKFRHSSPYTSPKGKSDLSPIGVLAHEMGHTLQFALMKNALWDQEGWLSIYRDLRKEALTSYAKVHSMEDFAESHRLYALNPKLLKELSPDRYAFVKKCWSKLLDQPVTKYRLTKAEFVDQFTKHLVLEV